MSVCDENFETTVVAAIELLRALPRAPASVDDARGILRDFAARHPAQSPEFLVDLAPGAEHADFDVYLAHPAGGTVSLSYRDDGGRPWFVDYSSHWAADRVLQIGDAHVSIQEAMFALQYLGETNPNLLEPLVRDALLTTTDAEDWSDETLDVTDDEIQRAADAFRQKHGLHSAADTHAWLETMGWSLHRFRSVLSGGLRLRKLEERLVRGRVEPDFAARRDDYDMVCTFRVVADDEAIVARLAEMASTSGLMVATQAWFSTPNTPIADAALATSRAYELDTAIASAPVGTVARDDADHGRYSVIQLVSRTPASLDAGTRRAIRERLIVEWVEKRKRDVRVQWSWT